MGELNHTVRIASTRNSALTKDAPDTHSSTAPLHALGVALWKLARVFSLATEPRAWASPVPVLPSTLALRSAIDHVHCAQRHLEPGSLLNSVQPAELERLGERLATIRTSGAGVDRDRRAHASALLDVACRTLSVPSKEHAMALRLRVHVGIRLDQGALKLQHLLRSFLDIESRQPEMWVHVYRTRRTFLAGELHFDTYRAMEVSSLFGEGKRRRRVTLARARAAYRKAIASSTSLSQSREWRALVGDHAHIEAMARTRIWEVAVCGRRWRTAVRAWRSLWDRCTTFCEQDLHRVEHFPTYALDFVKEAGLAFEDLEKAESVLMRAEHPEGREALQSVVARGLEVVQDRKLITWPQEETGSRSSERQLDELSE